VGRQSIKRYKYLILSNIDIRCSRFIDVQKKVKKTNNYKHVSLMDNA
jgi:hypothetical protein